MGLEGGEHYRAPSVKKAIFKAGYDTVKQAVNKSTKLTILAKKRRFGEDFNTWENLADIKLIARAALSCLVEFRGDFGEAARY